MNYLLMVLVGLARFVPHAWNITPIGATALFAGATCPNVATKEVILSS